MATSEPKYKIVEERSSKDSDDSESMGLLQPMTFGQSRRRALWPWVAHISLFLVSLSLFFFSLGVLQHNKSVMCDASEEPGWTQEHAPAVRAAGHRHGRMFLGEFDQPSPWRGQPNPDVDEAWEKISHASVISVTKEELERLGKFHNSSVMLPPETGGGYMASMESTHQMHCLNLLRMYSYREYYAHKLSHFADASKLRDHVDHCLEMLRQVIMCSTDLHIVTYDWVDHVDYPWPDFSVARQCRRWDNMMDWVRDRAAHSNQRQGLLIRPEGAATKPIHPVEYVHVDWEEPKQG